MTTDVADRLIRLREAAGINRKALSIRAGLNETYVRDIEIGKTRSPTVASLAKIAKALGVPIHELTGGTPGMSESAEAFHVPTPASDEAAQFAETTQAVADLMRSGGQRVTQAAITLEAIRVWQALQDLPARMPFRERLEFSLSELRSRLARK